jgi:hypothetical protein
MLALSFAIQCKQIHLINPAIGNALGEVLAEE